MNCNETFNAGICYVTDAYKRVCRFNEELHEDFEKYRAENAKLRELVADMWNDMCVCYESYVHISSSDMRFYGDRVRELGIEVER